MKLNNVSLVVSLSWDSLMNCGLLFLQLKQLAMTRMITHFLLLFQKQQTLYVYLVITWFHCRTKWQLLPQLRPPLCGQECRKPSSGQGNQRLVHSPCTHTHTNESCRQDIEYLSGQTSPQQIMTLIVPITLSVNGNTHWSKKGICKFYTWIMLFWEFFSMAASELLQSITSPSFIQWNFTSWGKDGVKDWYKPQPAILYRRTLHSAWPRFTWCFMGVKK